MTDPLADALTALCHEHALTALYVFGSRAPEVSARVAGDVRPVEHPGSDVGIGVLPSRAATAYSGPSRSLLAGATESLSGSF